MSTHQYEAFIRIKRENISICVFVYHLIPLLFHNFLDRLNERVSCNKIVNSLNMRGALSVMIHMERMKELFPNWVERRTLMKRN